MSLRANFPRFLAVSALAGALACGGSSKVQDLDQAPVGSEVIVERSESSRPDWAIDPPKDKDGMKFFSGGQEGYSDYALGMRMAKAEAMQEMGESVMSVWSSLLQASQVGGKDQLDQYARNFQELAVKQISLSGAETEERYYEKVAVKTAYGIEYRYNGFVLLKVPEQEYQLAQARALQQLKKQAQQDGDTSAEEFIDEAIQRLNQIKG
jgi:hypothetical protein